MGCTSTDVKEVIKNLLTLKCMDFVCHNGTREREKEGQE